MYDYKIMFKIISDETTFFGDGPATLLKIIDQEKSINKASKKMNMAYSKALRIIKKAETELGFKLVETQAGGKDGGGAKLTEKAAMLLKAYCEVSKKLDSTAKDLFETIIKPTLD